MTQAAELLVAAFAHHQAGRFAEAEALYRQILAGDPQNPDALHRLGVLCQQSNRHQEAVELIGRALALRPGCAEYANHLGTAYGALGQHDEAIAVLRRAVRMAPLDSSAHYNLGTALRNADRLADAAASFRHAVAANPNSAEAHYNLANTLRDMKQLAEAEASFRDALRVRPDYLKALVNLGNVLREQKRYAESIDVLARAVTLDPSHATARMNLGTVLRDAGRFVEAVDCLRQAVALNPRGAEAHNNLGTALQALARFDEAGACYEEALRLDPQLADAHFSRATHRLRSGDLAGGFAEYEWRWKCKTFADRGFPQPRWDGAPLAGRAVLLYTEQGLGDTLHFVRYAAWAKDRGGRVIVECQKPLLNLLSSCPFIDQLVPLGSTLPDFDVHAPLLSLPGILQLSESQLWRKAYFSAPPQLVEKWRGTLEAHAGFHVGVCWQGNPEHMFNSQRSFPLAALGPVARLPGVRLVSLQKGAQIDEIAGAGFDVLDLGPSFDEDAGPFVDSAAMIKNLDLVITADTAIAHLAGGLEAPAWLALSAHADWRWMLNREDTPWYPSMRLFRQRKLDRWDDVFERMAVELRSLAGDRVGSPGPKH
jgi:tetratricopeptide (TPR) repeat protein